MRRRSLIAAVLLTGGLAVVAQPAQAAAPAVQITKVYYDSPGVDRRGNASLNGEYVVVKNMTKKTVSVEDWTLRDRTGYRYTFGAMVIKPGRTVTVRTGQGDGGTSTVYWGRRAYVWNNDTDTAYLRRADGKLVDSCSYDSTRYDYKNC
ncbi:lamin tail domain-containing protein [Sphaerisporangium sp. TRM90804]|uniref:lamin tail domain-containing protein n=1 Tax=Sphaerisporangium sp. TRM90804 TaxID=3031113 RepID=UPI00244969C1|nr:lamin tail domain-containing protein [Sphaerisporangium sp. TRM90804]MDH2425353.1 lamin tail domain-containing protein [Sphaerisporangium sp. TRM90804]